MNKSVIIFLILFVIILNSISSFTEITDNNSIFGGNVTADKFFEVDGTYVIPIYKVNWNDGLYGDLDGLGLNATIKYSNLNNKIISSWNNITGKPTQISYWTNDIGYITNANLSFNLSDYFDDVGYLLSANFNWGNLSGKPTQISYWTNDIGYITSANLTKVKGDGVYTYNTTLGGVTTIHFNETKLNNTIQQLTGIFEENVTISVSGGVGSGTTSLCCSGASNILEIAVFPTTSTNNYKFSANSTITNSIIDKDRATHVGDWIVSHSGSVIFNENIYYYLKNVNIDESFRVRVRWQR